MGVTELGKLLPREARRELDLAGLSGRTIALDAYNALYQFLASIRQPDGTPLMDRHGNVTSHLNGLLYRTINLLENGVRPVYVFDGRPPEAKTAELLQRKRQKEKALVELERALQEGKRELVRKYAQRAVYLTDEMVEDAKRLLTYMGVPWVQAPGEGEAQAAYMAIRGDAWATGSQDYDSLLFGSPRLVRNLTITGRRKLPNRDEYVEIRPELIELDAVLRHLKLKSREQLVYLAILLGTDYNPDGVPGIGPQKALRMVHEVPSLEDALNTVLKGVKWPVDPRTIMSLFLNPKVTEQYSVEFSQPRERELVEFLVEQHDFSRERVERAIERLKAAYAKIRGGTTLDSFFS